MNGGQWQLTTSLSLQATHLAAGAAATQSLSTSLSAAQSLPYGTGAGTFTIGVQARRTLGPLGTETLDLYTGTDLVDVFGLTAAFRTMRAWAVWIVSGGGTSGVTVNGGAANPLGLFLTGTTPGATVYPSGPAAGDGSPAGVAVTTTARNLRVTNNDPAPVTYVLALAGTQNVSGEAGGLLLAITYP